jgi:hypothetical protein
MKTIACLAIFACALTVGGAAQAQDIRHSNGRVLYH